ncbi:uncharacterized protein LOC128206160 isoform X1 [Mya arenaria]|uniref:uncharacterized protein LOC128206160 isoform X1 n=1 Tax=Mya arenaria TaxID=6604 RepID=UPI0022E45200|nr:uncharacterized protein LOC128206160 isoform X1 [Mya arenaria]XP_052764415.1 uncharacterized protein LOC128206160 isoform X1 [Mya arenaria]
MDDYIVEKKEYSPKDFFEKFSKKLPKIVMITQGYCGEIQGDTFDRGMVIRFQTISRQSRVIAQFRLGKNVKHVSIPQKFEQPVCVKGTGKKARTIAEILQEQTLPCVVEFPKKTIITVGNRRINTNNIPEIDLTGTFDEIYLLGNYIDSDILETEVIRVPLYLTQLRLAVVTGHKNKSKDEWHDFNKYLDNRCGPIFYDTCYGNPEMAHYKEQLSAKDGAEHSYVEPCSYINFWSLVHKPYANVNSTKTEDEIICVGESFDGMDAYEPMEIITKANTSHFKTRNSQQINLHKPFMPLPAEKPDIDIYENSETLSDQFKENKHGDVEPNKDDSCHLEENILFAKSRLKPVKAKPESSATAQETHNMPIGAELKEKTPAARLKNPPAHGSKPKLPIKPTGWLKSSDPPEILGKTSIKLAHNVQQVKIVSQDNTPVPSSVRTSAMVAPVTVDKEASDHKFLKPESQYIVARVPETDTQIDLPVVEKPEDVCNLTVREVTGYLERMNLSSYAQQFLDNDVDGVLLTGLTKNDLMTDFGMKGVEAQKIINFCKEAHLPKK